MTCSKKQTPGLGVSSVVHTFVLKHKNYQLNDVFFGVWQAGGQVDQLFGVLVHEELLRHFVLKSEPIGSIFSDSEKSNPALIKQSVRACPSG
jgi:hypothetical protein